MSPLKEPSDIKGALKEAHPSPASSEAIQLARITRDSALQVRSKVDEATVKRYATAMEVGIEFPPIKLARVNDVLYLVDGWHRVSAAYEIGRSNIEAEIYDMTMKHAAWWAAEANLKHGLPLKASERRNVFRAYVKAGRHRKSPHRYKSYREISEELHGIGGHTTVRSWMKKFYPKIFKEMGGKTFHGNSAATQPPLGTSIRPQAQQALDTLITVEAHIKAPADRCWLIKELELMLSTFKSEDVHPRLEEDDECEF